MDFVLFKEDDIVPVEAKLSGRVGRGFYSFLRSYSPERAVIVTPDYFGRRKVGKTRVFFVPAWYF